MVKGLVVRFQRSRTLFSDEGFSKIQKSNILLLGVGGVGSYTLDCLYRSGVKNITIVDYDTYDETNRNRQIGSDCAIGECKVSTLAKLYTGIRVIRQKVDISWVKEFDFEPYDIVIDAIDTTCVKIELAKKCYPKLLMSLGSAKRVDASKIEVSTIWKSHGDALARKIRYELKRAKFNRNFTVVFSPEEPLCKDKGSFVGVTGTFGMMLCSEAIKRILNSK